MANDTPTLTQLLRRAFKSQIAEVHTGIPAVVLSYNKTLQAATVKPVIAQRNEQNAVIDYPAIGEIPVHFAGGNGTAITHPIGVGDYVWLAFAEVSIDDWLELGGDSQIPSSIRRFQVSDGVVIPGIRPFATPLPELAVDVAAIVLYGSAVKVGDSSANKATARADNVEALLLELASHVAVGAGIGYPTGWTAFNTNPVYPIGSIVLFTNDPDSGP